MNDRTPTATFTALLGLALATPLLGGCSKTAAPPAAIRPIAIPVHVVALRYTRIAVPIELSGSLESVRSVTVGAMTAGRIERVDVRVGDVVHSGDVIAQIDTAGSAAALDQARAGAAAAAASAGASDSAIGAADASSASARAQLAAARAREALSATTATRMRSLYAQGAISKQQRDQVQADFSGAHAAVAQAQAGVDGARDTLAAARAQSRAASNSASQAQAGVVAATIPLRDATLVAPFDGIVVKRFVEPGAVVAPGSPVVSFENAHDLEVDVAAPDDAIAALSPGTLVDVRVDAVGNRPIPARLRAIVPSQNPALRSATLKIALPNMPGLQPGMFARVSIVGHGHLGWVAPLAALVTRAGQSGVFTIREGTASFVPLQTGIVGAASVELIGIDGRAMEVAVTGLQRIDDGSRVTVVR